MKIVVTGAGGLVGSAVVRLCTASGDEVGAFPHEALDISDEAGVERVLLESRAEVLINCAAYTNVDGAESDKEKCYEINATAVGGLARACARTGAGFLTISTDFVFDGAKEGFYSESDEPLPLSVYGLSKLAGEKEAVEGNARSIVVRTGWIFGNGGTNFLCAIPDLLNRKSGIKTISDAYGTPTFAEDLARRLRELTVLDRPGLYHVTNSGDGTSYSGFAFKTAEIGGYDAALITEVKSRELERPAPRPLNSKLACEAVRELGLSELPHWHDAIVRRLKQ